MKTWPLLALLFAGPALVIGAEKSPSKIHQQFANAIESAKQGDCSEASSNLKAISRKLRTHDLLYYYLSRCWAEKSEFSTAFKMSANAYEKMPQLSSRYASMRLTHAYLLAKLKRPSELKPLWSSLPKPWDLEEAEEIKELAAIATFYFDGFVMVRDLTRQVESEQWRRALYLALLAKVPKPNLTEITQGSEPTALWPEPLFLKEQANAYYVGKQYRQALTIYKQYYEKTQDPMVLGRMGRIHKLLGERAEEERYFQLQVSKAPTLEDASQSRIQLGRYYWNMNRNDEAIQAFAKVWRNAKGDLQEAVFAVYMHGRVLESIGKGQEAESIYPQVMRFNPTDEFHQRRKIEALLRLGWLAYKEKKWSKAWKQFQLALDADPLKLMNDETRFWMGMTQASMGNAEKAHSLFASMASDYPHAYFGLLTRKRLQSEARPRLRLDELPDNPIASTANAAAGATISDAIPNSPPAAEDRPWSKTERELLLRYEELAESGLNELASDELGEISWQGLPQTSHLELAARFQRIGDSFSTVRLAKYATGYEERRVKSIWLPYLFPLPSFWPLVQRYCARNGVDPYLVLALMRQESEFRNQIISSADAYGLMQILPGLSRHLSTALALPSPEPKELFDEELNIRLGTFHLANLLKRYKNNVVYAFAAYNGSESAVSRWRSRLDDGSNALDFIEEITYGETKHYVKMLLRNYFLYQYAATGFENLNVLP